VNAECPVEDTVRPTHVDDMSNDERMTNPTVTLPDLQAQIAEEVAAYPATAPSELVPVCFRARIQGGLVEIAPSSILGDHVSGWTACIDPNGNRPRWVKRSLFWSYNEDDAASFKTPQEALAAAKRAS